MDLNLLLKNWVEGNAVYEDALTGQTIEARTLKELMQEIAIQEVEAEYMTKKVF